jgi:hypothetical protein
MDKEERDYLIAVFASSWAKQHASVKGADYTYCGRKFSGAHGLTDLKLADIDDKITCKSCKAILRTRTK